MMQRHMLPGPLLYREHANARILSLRKSFCILPAAHCRNCKKDLAVAYTALHLMGMHVVVELWLCSHSLSRCHHLHRYSRSCPACGCSICCAEMMILLVILTGSIF